MTNLSTSRLTERSTSGSQPLILLSWSLETLDGTCRLKVTGGPVRGVCEVHQWSFTAKTLTAALLEEIGTVAALLGQSGLLGAVGMQGELAFELQEAAESLRA